MKQLRALAVVLGILTFQAAPASAQKNAVTGRSSEAVPPEWSKISATCNATARKSPTESARRIADIARDEFYAFGGHRIDSNGRMFSFGVVESEQEESADNITQYRLRHLGWWNVLRYWRLLDASKTPEDAAKESLYARGFPNAAREPDDKNAAPPETIDLTRALSAIDAIPKNANLTPSERDILKQSIIRAAINDVAWSAAFVGAVMRQAGLSAEAFDFADAHATYIYAAFASSLAEGAGQSQQAHYRACPTTAARPRPGDFLCYHRHNEFAANSASEIRNRILGDIVSDAPKKTVRRSHCDVVVHTDLKARRVYVVGGNVQQAVTVKKLQLDRIGRLIEKQPDNCNLDGPWRFPKPAEGKPVAPHLSDTCTLNRSSWFVLLQAR